MANISVIGLGSIGSLMALSIAKCGQKITTLIDKDIVEAKNLSKSAYTLSSVDQPKVFALRDILINQNPEFKNIRTFQKFTEELDASEFRHIFVNSDMIVHCADSKKSLKTLVKQAVLNHKETGKDTIIISIFCLDNAAAGITALWSPTFLYMPCPYCIVSSVPYLNSAEERIDNDPTEYSSDRLAGGKIKGLYPDLLFGISLTVSLIQALAAYIDNPTLEYSGRDCILRSFMTHNIHIWVPFRDPVLDWQIPTNTGRCFPLEIENSCCPACGRGLTATTGLFVKQGATLETNTTTNGGYYDKDAFDQRMGVY